MDHSEKQTDAIQCTRLRLRWSLIDLAAELLFLAILAFLSRLYARRLMQLGWKSLLALCLAAACVYLVLAFALRYHLVRIEHRFGVISKSRGWAIRIVLNGVFGQLILVTMLVATIFFARRTIPQLWWIVVLGLSAFFNGLYCFYLPKRLWGYRYNKLEKDDPRIQPLRSFLDRFGFGKIRIFCLQVQTHSRALLAACWATSWPRLFLSDTLLENCSPLQLQTIVAHELGHIKHHDSVGAFAGSVLMCLVLVAAACGMMVRLAPDAHSVRQALAAAPMVLLCLSLISFVFRPMVLAGSRARERRANREALEMTEDPAAFISAMQMLSDCNLMAGQPNWWQRLLFQRAPSLDEMIQQARSFADQRGLPLPPENTISHA